MSRIVFVRQDGVGSVTRIIVKTILCASSIPNGQVPPTSENGLWKEGRATWPAVHEIQGGQQVSLIDGGTCLLDKRAAWAGATHLLRYAPQHQFVGRGIALYSPYTTQRRRGPLTSRKADAVQLEALCLFAVAALWHVDRQAGRDVRSCVVIVHCRLVHAARFGPQVLVLKVLGAGPCTHTTPAKRGHGGAGAQAGTEDELSRCRRAAIPPHPTPPRKTGWRARRHLP